VRDIPERLDCLGEQGEFQAVGNFVLWAGGALHPENIERARTAVSGRFL